MRKNKNWIAQLKTITTLFRIASPKGLSKIIMPFKRIVQKRSKKLSPFQLPTLPTIPRIPKTPGVSNFDISKPVKNLRESNRIKVASTWPYSEAMPTDLPAEGEFLTKSYVKESHDQTQGQGRTQIHPQLVPHIHFHTKSRPSHTYKIYIPSNSNDQPLPLLIMLHGCTQNPDDFATGTAMNLLAEEQKFIVAYPAQTQSANAQKCWNWFRTDDQSRGKGEPSIIAGITQDIIRDYPVDTARVYIAGLSAGGAMAVTVATLYPDIYAAVGVHSGLPYASANNVPSALSAMRNGSSQANCQQLDEAALTAIPMIVFHGDQDHTVNASNGEHLIQQNIAAQNIEIDSASPQNISVQTGKTDGGHTYSTTSYYDSDGHSVAEHWVIHGAGHAWSGGNPAGSYTDAKGPDASREMLRFFLSHQSLRLSQYKN